MYPEDKQTFLEDVPINGPTDLYQSIKEASDDTSVAETTKAWNKSKGDSRTSAQ